MRVKLITLLVVLGLALGTGQLAHAGTVILEGSDSIGLHCPSGTGTLTGTDGAACDYKEDFFRAVSAGGDIAVIYGTGNPISGVLPAAGTIHNFASVAAAGALSSYAAVWLEAGFSCCSEQDGLVTAPGAESALLSYLAGGGTVIINDYEGGAAYDNIVGNTSHVSTAGHVTTSGCGSDRELVTAEGLLNGFHQPGPVGCWEHQGYDVAFFEGFGFTHNFFTAGPEMTSGSWTKGGSGLLATGRTVSAPEPASLILLGTGLVGLAIRRRRAQ